MNKRQSNAPQTGLPNVKLCPNCGFPNKNTGIKCSYCEAPIQTPASLPPGKWIRAVFSKLKWNWKCRNRKKAYQAIEKGLTAIIGLTLCFVGGYIFTSSVFTKSFSNCIFSLFFLLYGIFTLKHLFKK